MGLDITFDDAYGDDNKLPQNILPKQLETLAERPPLVIDNAKPLGVPEPQRIEGKGFLDTAFHDFLEGNWAYRIVNNMTDAPAHSNPMAEDVPDGWKVTADDFEETPDKYWPWLMHAHGPKQLQLIKDEIHDRTMLDEAYANGSLAGSLVGGMAAFITSPAALIPMASALKYAKTPGYVLKNMTRAVPGMAAQSAVHNSFLESMETNPSLENLAVNTFRDTVFGTALEGLGLTVASGVKGSELYAARKAMNNFREGIGVKRVITKEGKDTGKMAAHALPGSSVGAAEVDRAQEFLESTIAKKGVFALPAAQKLFSSINPQIRGQFSRFSSVRPFFQRTGESATSLLTEGTLAGAETPQTFEGYLTFFKDRSSAVVNELHGLWHEANGIDSTLAPARALKALKQRLGDAQQFTWDEFGREVYLTIVNGGEHDNKSINTAVEKLRNHYNETYDIFREAMGYRKEWRPPVTAEEYATRVFNQDALNVKSEDWDRLVSAKLKEQDMLIQAEMAPIESLTKQIDELNTKIKALAKGTEEYKEASRELRLKRNNRNHRQKQLANRISKDRSLLMLAEDKAHLSHDESMELQALMEKQNKIKREINKAKKAGKKDEVRKLEEKLQAEEDALYQQAYNGEINPNLYMREPESGRLKFKDPKDLLRFRRVYENDQERIGQAQQYRSVIQNHTPGQVYDQLFSGMSGHAIERPNLARSIMIEDSFFINNGFMSTDLNHNLRAYDTFMGRKIAMKKIFSDMGYDSKEELSNALAKEYQKMDAELNSIKDEKKRAKEKRKLKKDFDNTKKDIAATHDRMLGRAMGSEDARKWASIARNFAIMTRLGFVPITMVADLAAVTMKHGIWPTIRDGIMPMLEDLHNIGQGAEGRAVQENAAHAHLALNHVQNGYADRMFSGDAIADIPIGTGWSNKLHNVSDRLAHLTGNMAGTNYIDNFLQRLTATITQSKIISYMEKFEAGTISETERQALLMHGLDPEKWSTRFLNGWKEQGSDGNGIGGKMSHYYNWSDTEASNVMMHAIRRSVRDTILRSGLMSSPFVGDSTIGSLFLLFKGWGFEAAARYTAPLLQAPDARKLMGVMVMMGAGALVDPMRKLAKGENPVDEDDNMFGAALSNSGVLGVFTDGIQDANLILNNKYLAMLTNDRYRNRSFMGMIGGPLGGVAEDIKNTISMFANREINEHDMKKAARLIPFANLWQFYQLTNKLVESQGYPATRREARR